MLAKTVPQLCNNVVCREVNKLKGCAVLKCLMVKAGKTIVFSTDLSWMTRLRMWWAPPVSVWVAPAGGGPVVSRRVWVWCANHVCGYVYRVSWNQRASLKNWNETEFSLSLCSVLFLLSSLARQERDRIRPHAGHHTSKGVLHLVSDSGDLEAIRCALVPIPLGL
jgi:hypothetical protein